MIHVLIALCIIGFFLWIVPLEPGIKNIIVGLVAIAVGLWLLSATGIIHTNLFK